MLATVSASASAARSATATQRAGPPEGRTDGAANDAAAAGHNHDLAGHWSCRCCPDMVMAAPSRLRSCRMPPFSTGRQTLAWSRGVTRAARAWSSCRRFLRLQGEALLLDRHEALLGRVVGRQALRWARLVRGWGT